ncbi:hypothetical protein [Pseudonocardia xinjiangensis]|uniref:LexA-binding, inner membrane-associated hydrolase n=1 Tax=Pseudonocardia xinjiangensis TaxID=75289 RepID=A0ABX1RCX8_9PSEU|nr:hypothetical protein [Pseudonocardia xinjiangensis]NMH77754.1 hypothetical protein [Pseudonocardia xinjiangensis]
MNTTPPPTSTPSRPRARTTRALAAAAKRWPTLVGVAAGADTLLAEVTDDATHRLAEALLILPMLYVIVAALHFRRATWPVFFVCIALFIALRLQDWLAPSVVLLAIALAASIWGTSHGHHRERDFRLQLVGMAGFGALAVAGLVVDPDLGRYLVAAGWLGHAVWDWVHLAKDRVVSRSYAEWCGAVDVMIAVGLVAGPLL